ncbi:MAG: hypothetical protein WCP97_09375 [bacterium]
MSSLDYGLADLARNLKVDRVVGGFQSVKDRVEYATYGLMEHLMPRLQRLTAEGGFITTNKMLFAGVGGVLGMANALLVSQAFGFENNKDPKAFAEFSFGFKISHKSLLCFAALGSLGILAGRFGVTDESVGEFAQKAFSTVESKVVTSLGVVVSGALATLGMRFAEKRSMLPLSRLNKPTAFADGVIAGLLAVDLLT